MTLTIEELPGIDSVKAYKLEKQPRLEVLPRSDDEKYVITSESELDWARFCGIWELLRKAPRKGPPKTKRRHTADVGFRLFCGSDELAWATIDLHAGIVRIIWKDRYTFFAFDPEAARLMSIDFEIDRIFNK